MNFIGKLEQEFPQISFSIIADSPFSSCCPDFMSAKHIDATALIHFGYKCDTECPLPILHIQDSYELDPLKLLENLKSFGQKIYVTGTSEKNIQQTKSILTDNEKNVVEIQSEADSVIFVGNGCCVSSLVQSSEQNIWTLGLDGLEMHNSYSFISKRFHYIAQVQDAQVFGIIISSLSVYNRIKNNLRGLLQHHHKTFYPIYIGKITDLKLGNFREIDMFVMVSCSNTPLPDNKNFYRPVITPFELEIGLLNSWQGRYSTSFTSEFTSKPLYTTKETESRFSNREFKGLEPEVQGSINLEQGYSGIAMVYKSELS